MNRKSKKSPGKRHSRNNDSHSADHSRNNDTNQLERRKSRWPKRLLIFFFAAVAIWFIGDFAYSRYVANEIKAWESKVTWDDDGIQRGAQEFKIGNGPIAILMIHGFSDSPQIYRKIAPPLADDGYTCRGILLPGFGKTVQDYADATREQWIEKVDSEIRELQKTHSTIIVVAHSLGGAITINQLLKTPNCVDGVVLIAPAVEVSNERSPLFSTRFWHEFSKWTLPSSSIAKSPFELDVRDETERNRPLRNQFSPRSVIDNAFVLMDENRGRAGEIETPLLMFVSTEDKIIDTPAIERYYEQWGGAPKKLVKLADSGHMIPVDVEWETVKDEINDFAIRVATGSKE